MGKSLVQQQFGASSAAYATSAVHANGASLGRVVELVQPQGDWHVLDVATGAGHMAAAVAPYVADVIASDITAEMLDQAAALARKKALSNITTIEADAEALPFPDRAFDFVTCRIAPHHFSDVPRFVWEVRRVLKDGGTLALIDNISPDDRSLPGFSKADLKDAAVSYNTFEKLRDPSHVRALTMSEWLELLQDAGFAVVAEEILPKSMEFKDWVERMKVPRETVDRLEEMLRDAKPAFRAFLRPAGQGEASTFTLDEALVVCRKRGDRHE